MRRQRQNEFTNEDIPSEHDPAVACAFAFLNGTRLILIVRYEVTKYTEYTLMHMCLGCVFSSGRHTQN